MNCVWIHKYLILCWHLVSGQVLPHSVISQMLYIKPMMSNCICSLIEVLLTGTAFLSNCFFGSFNPVWSGGLLVFLCDHRSAHSQHPRGIEWFTVAKSERFSHFWEMCWSPAHQRNPRYNTNFGLLRLGLFTFCPSSFVPEGYLPGRKLWNGKLGKPSWEDLSFTDSFLLPSSQCGQT